MIYFFKELPRSLKNRFQHLALKGKVHWSNYHSNISRNRFLILGNQKSGTTAIATLFAKATGQDATLDIPSLWDPNYGHLLSGQLELKQIVDRQKYFFSRKVIKEPNLTFFYDQIKLLYPDSKIIFIVRHPLQNIRSLLDRINLPGNLISLDYYKPGMAHNELMLFSKEHYSFYSDNYIEMLALRWKFCANVYLENKADMYLVKYEDFIQDKKGFIRQLAGKFGLPIKAEFGNMVNYPFQPKGNQMVDLKTFYGNNYVRILKICEDELNAFSY